MYSKISGESEDYAHLEENKCGEGRFTEGEEKEECRKNEENMVKNGGNGRGKCKPDLF